MSEEIAIHVHLWWEHRIRKVTIRKGGTSIVIWFRNFGYVSIIDEKVQNIFAGIIKGLLLILPHPINRSSYNIFKYPSLLMDK
jgi:hypothetical protein